MSPEEAAALLRAARVEGRTLEPFTDTHADLDEAWGYAVQRLDLADRVRHGERPVGAKLGLTSEAKQQRMGVRRPVVGFLTDAMLLPDGPVDAGRWVQPRVEPEIAFLTGRRIDRVLGPTEVASYVAGVGVAAEVLDSRWTGYRFRLPDVLADATSAAGFVLGAAVHDLGEVGAPAALRGEVRVDGRVVERATGAAVLGDPLRALVLLSEHLAARGEALPEGSWVLAGALTDAVPLTAGHRYEVEVEALGAIRLDAR